MSEPIETSAEAAVLGSAMIGSGTAADMSDLVARLSPDDFYAPTNAAIWSAICDLHDQGQQPLPAAVKALLDRRKEKNDPVQLIDMTRGAPLLASAAWYADQVRDAAGRRRLAGAAAKIGQLALATSSDIETLREEARAAVDEACAGLAVSEARTMAQLLPEVLDIAQNGRAKVLSTGWEGVDHVIGGLAPGRLVIVGARPAVGKSLLGTNLALQFAGTHAHAVLIASLEMDGVEVVQRLLANHAKVRLTGLTEGTTTDAEWDVIGRTAQQLEDMPIRVVDRSNQTVTSIRRHARDFQRERDDLALIVVDYLQLLDTRERKGASRAEALAEVSRGLKNLARETGACVVAMAQVNRESTRSGDGRPRMHDLRESGAIEADADVVLMLHRTEEDRESGELEVIIEKNRHGYDGMTIKLTVQGHMARVIDSLWSPTRSIA